MVMTAFDVRASDAQFDLIVVDESHRLNQRANQPSGVLNKKFADINTDIFGNDDTTKNQLDWLRAKSKHQIFLMDAAQSVRPADLPEELLETIARDAKLQQRYYALVSQLRVQAGADYVGYIRRILGTPTLADPTAIVARETFDGYDFRQFDSLQVMISEIRARDAEAGLSRVLAGIAWPWNSKKDESAYDIEVDGCQLRWNSATTDWIASKNALEEVGSIHTVQGYDLNYAGVIIGTDLRYIDGKIVVDRKFCFDVKSKENNRISGRITTDDDLLRFIRNVYAVLLTRGIRGTYVYVCDPGLREYLPELIPGHVVS